MLVDFSEVSVIKYQNDRLDEGAAHVASGCEGPDLPHIYLAFTLALNAGMHDAEIKKLSWAQINLQKSSWPLAVPRRNLIRQCSPDLTDFLYQVDVQGNAIFDGDERAHNLFTSFATGKMIVQPSLSPMTTI